MLLEDMGDASSAEETGRRAARDGGMMVDSAGLVLLNLGCSLLDFLSGLSRLQIERVAQALDFLLFCFCCFLDRVFCSSGAR